MARLLLPLLVLLALPALALPAWAEEVFVLDSGNVVRGRIVRENEEQVVIRLSGFVEENRLTLRPSEIVRRYTGVDPDRSSGRPRALSEPVVPMTIVSAQDGVPRTVLLAPDLLGSRASTAGLREDEDLARERAMANEGFFARLSRVAVVAMPTSLEGRLLLGMLLLIVMAVLVAGGTQLLGMKAASLHASTSLGLLLGVFLVTDILWSDALLRADRALWVLPLQALIWLGAARSTLDAPLSRTIPLFALVLFASTCFVFATGSLLVSV
jgi:hypothetical protein